MHYEAKGGGTEAERSDLRLSLTVVRYTDRPDRCTVYPPDASGDARMAEWITVNREVCVDLGPMR